MSLSISIGNANVSLDPVAFVAEYTVPEATVEGAPPAPRGFAPDYYNHLTGDSVARLRQIVADSDLFGLLFNSTDGLLRTAAPGTPDRRAITHVKPWMLARVSAVADSIPGDDETRADLRAVAQWLQFWMDDALTVDETTAAFMWELA